MSVIGPSFGSTPTQPPGVYVPPDPFVVPPPAPPSSGPTGMSFPSSPLQGVVGDAQQNIAILLHTLGLDSLISLAWSMLTQGLSPDQVHEAIKNTQEYHDRFKGMDIRKQNGLNAISEADYITLENSYREAAHANGLLPGSYDAATAIGNGVSPNEFNNRAQMAAQEIFHEPPQFQTLMLDYYGLQPGQIASYYLNPTNALPRLQQMLYSGEIGGEAAQLGYSLSRQAAESVANAGFTGDTARSGLAKVAAESPLFDESISDRGQNLTPETGVLAQFGINADAIKQVQDRAQRRAAIAQAGGGSVVTQGGVLGESIAK